MLIQIQVEGWTFSLDRTGFLTIHTDGKTISHKHNGMTPDELKGFAHGWVASQLYMTRDSELVAAKYPVYLPM
jgi:hypothetical protein